MLHKKWIVLCVLGSTLVAVWMTRGVCLAERKKREIEYGECDTPARINDLRAHILVVEAALTAHKKDVRNNYVTKKEYSELNKEVEALKKKLKANAKAPVKPKKAE